MVYKSFNRKCIILIFTALLLLITSCATTPREQPIDLTGVWTGTLEYETCDSGAGERPMSTKITQEGNRITFRTKIPYTERNVTSYGILKGNIIYVKEYSWKSITGYIVIEHDSELVISQDKNTYKGTWKWSLAESKGGPIFCPGTRSVVMRRKSNK